MLRYPTLIMEHLTYHVARLHSQRALKVSMQVFQISSSFILWFVLVPQRVPVCFGQILTDTVTLRNPLLKTSQTSPP